MICRKKKNKCHCLLHRSLFPSPLWRSIQRVYFIRVLYHFTKSHPKLIFYDMNKKKCRSVRIL